MGRAVRVSGIAWLFVALAAICVGGPLGQAAEAAPPRALAALPPNAGPGANFDRGAYIDGLRDAPGIMARVGVACTIQQAVYEGEASLLDAHGRISGRANKLFGASCQLKSGRSADPEIGAAESAGADPGVISQPDWLSKPDAALFANVYPLKAQMAHVSGQATISCRVVASGRLERCGVIDESPVEFGFGVAALTMSHAFRMRPMTRDGKPVAGGKVEIPIHFGIKAW